MSGIGAQQKRKHVGATPKGVTVEIVGRTSVHPLLFYSGKSSGYLIWVLLVLDFVLGLYSIVVYHFIVRAEERYLESAFGAPYSEYSQRVRRYL